MDEIVSNKFQLKVHPNPAHGEIRVHYTLSKSSFVKFRLYDVLGKLQVESLENMNGPGSYSSVIRVSENLKGVFFLKWNQMVARKPAK
ncbi:MAG: T9SS type A sorting domain-containing protein [Bacteroidetes bacterium]|nr:T9SS type A sorting domain-containing protein [Bacteroidota bacterium]